MNEHRYLDRSAAGHCSETTGMWDKATLSQQKCYFLLGIQHMHIPHDDNENEANAFGAADIEEEKEEKEQKIWPNGNKNPDYLLAQIYSANPGFASKMGNKGSFLIRRFVNEMMKDLNNNSSRFVEDIFDEIQHKLQEKQQTEHRFNNGTRYIQFKRNNAE